MNLKIRCKSTRRSLQDKHVKHISCTATALVYPGYSDQLTDQPPDCLPRLLHLGALDLGLYLHDAGVLCICIYIFIINNVRTDTWYEESFFLVSKTTLVFSNFWWDFYLLIISNIDEKVYNNESQMLYCFSIKKHYMSKLSLVF